MIAEKIIQTTQEVDLDITNVTLLTLEEARQLSRKVRVADGVWWLRSPGYYEYSAAFVHGEDGSVDVLGFNVNEPLGVRPALEIANLESAKLKIGDRFNLADECWTVINEDKALCDDIVGKTPFREYWRAEDANDYDASDIKKWLEKWAKDKGIVKEEQG